MSRSINLAILYISLPYFLFACAIMFDVEFSSVRISEWANLQTAATIGGGAIGGLVCVYILVRWTQLSSFLRIRKQGELKFSSNLSRNGRKWSLLYGGMEASGSLGMGVFVVTSVEEMFLFGLFHLLRASEIIVYLLFASRYFGVVMTDRNIAYLQRDARVIPLAEVKKVEPRHDELVFASTQQTWKFPLGFLPDDTTEDFVEKVRLLTDKGIYVSDAVGKKLVKSY